MDLLKASAVDISEAVRSKKISAKEVFQFL